MPVSCSHRGSRGHVASILRAQGDLAGARSRQEQALALQEQSGGKTAAALCRQDLARTALEQGRPAEAEALARAAATELIGQSENRRDSLYVSIVAARVLAASGKPADAERSLQAAIAEAQKMHLLDRELESRLALSEIELASGKASAGRMGLAALKKRAAEKGFSLIARKAAAAEHKAP